MKAKQRGISLGGIMILLVIGGFVVMMAMRLVPIYLADLKIANAMEALSTSDEGKTRELLVGRFMRQLDIEDIRTIKKDELKLEPKGGGFDVTLNYEVRVPVIYNIDAVVKFSHHREIR